MKFHISLLATVILAGCGGGTGSGSNSNTSPQPNSVNAPIPDKTPATPPTVTMATPDKPNIQTDQQLDEEASLALNASLTRVAPLAQNRFEEIKIAGGLDDVSGQLIFTALYYQLNQNYLPEGTPIHDFIDSDDLDEKFPGIRVLLNQDSADDLSRLAIGLILRGNSRQDQLDTQPRVDVELLSADQKQSLATLINQRYDDHNNVTSLAKILLKAFNLNQSLHLLDLIQGDLIHDQNIQAEERNTFNALLPIRSNLQNSPYAVALIKPDRDGANDGQLPPQDSFPEPPQGSGIDDGLLPVITVNPSEDHTPSLVGTKPINEHDQAVLNLEQSLRKLKLRLLAVEEQLNQSRPEELVSPIKTIATELGESFPKFSQEEISMLYDFVDSLEAQIDLEDFLSSLDTNSKTGSSHLLNLVRLYSVKLSEIYHLNTNYLKIKNLTSRWYKDFNRISLNISNSL